MHPLMGVYGLPEGALAYGAQQAVHGQGSPPPARGGPPLTSASPSAAAGCPSAALQLRAGSPRAAGMASTATRLHARGEKSMLYPHWMKHCQLECSRAACRRT